jgi:molybdenum cofactor synthesis domain-containing protein
MTTAAVVVIGNEILSGKFQDANSPWLASRCRELGIDLVRIHVIPDEVEVIAGVVAAASALCDHVFTTGGVGPTHDDVTMAGVARAFDVPLERHPELARVLVEKMGDRATPAAMRMADLPQGAALWWDGELFFPQVVVRNVLIFPGVPGLMRRKFDGIAHRLSTGGPVHSARVTTTEAESAIAARLDAAQQRFPTVAIGSYPQFDHKPWTVTVTLDSRDAAALSDCLALLQEQLADGLIGD